MPRIPAAAGKRHRKRRRHRRRGAGGGAADVGPDRFTDLNDDLLRIILHRLPISSAASLAGASRHFRAQVPALLDRVDSLTLHEPHFPTPLPDARPLILRRLTIAPHNAIPPSSFSPILKTVAGHGLKELNFTLNRRSPLPRNIFFIRSLAVLRLDTCAVPRWSRIACPCLRTLKLIRVSIHQETINQVLASASCLSTLEMMYCTGHGAGARACAVESSSVRTLVINPPLKQAQVAIRASGLRTVTLHMRAKARRLELAPAPEIRKAYLNIHKPLRPMGSVSVRPFLDGAVMLNSLTLRGLAMKLLSSEYKDTTKLEVVFQNMRILSVSLNLSTERQSVFLLKLLESCPNLQQLNLSYVNTDEGNPVKKFKHKVKVIETDDDDISAETDDDDMAFETDDDDMAAETDGDMSWVTEDDDTAETEDIAAQTVDDNAVPCFTDHEERLTKILCLANCLEEFKFHGFKPGGYGKDLIVFLLTRAKNLKKVGVLFEKSKEATVKEILSVRKAPAQRTFNKYGSLYLELDYS